MAWCDGQALRAATERGVDRAKGMAEGERVPFFACGLSSVMHPKVSHAPQGELNSTPTFSSRLLLSESGHYMVIVLLLYVYVDCVGCVRRSFLHARYFDPYDRGDSASNPQE